MQNKDILSGIYDTLRFAGIVHTMKDFAELLGVNYSNLTQAIKGNEKYLTQSLISKANRLLATYQVDKKISVSNSPHTNVATTGGQINLASSPEDRTNESEDMVPVIPTYLYKEANINILEYVQDDDNEVPMTPAVQQFPKTDAIYSVQTMAMYPHLHQGDLIALKVISKDAPIVNGEMYAVDTKELGLLVRFAYDRGDHIEMRASEKADRFESFNIMKTDIFNIFRVVGMIRVNI